MKNIKYDQKGFGLLEIVLVIAIGLMVFLSIENYLDYSLKAVNRDANRIEALYFAKASLEEARAARDEKNGDDYQYGWDQISPPNITLGSEYNFQPDLNSPAKWVIIPGTKTIGKYTMWIVIAAVERDVNDNIVAGGGTADDNTLKINSYVTWSEADGSEQVSLSEFLTNFR